jgi:hypothetical protein
VTLVGTPTSPWPVCYDAQHLGWKIDATTAKRVPIAHSEAGRAEGTSPRSFGRRRRGNPYAGSACSAGGSDGGAHGLASLWDPRLSIMTMSPRLRGGPSTLSAEHPFGIEKEALAIMLLRLTASC